MCVLDVCCIPTEKKKKTRSHSTKFIWSIAGFLLFSAGPTTISIYTCCNRAHTSSRQVYTGGWMCSKLLLRLGFYREKEHKYDLNGPNDDQNTTPRISERRTRSSRKRCLAVIGQLLSVRARASIYISGRRPLVVNPFRQSTGVLHCQCIQLRMYVRGVDCTLPPKINAVAPKSTVVTTGPRGKTCIKMQ